MQYFQAVKIGKERASKAQMILFDLAGFAMLTLTTKKKMESFSLLEKRFSLPLYIQMMVMLQF